MTQTLSPIQFTVQHINGIPSLKVTNSIDDKETVISSYGRFFGIKEVLKALGLSRFVQSKIDEAMDKYVKENPVKEINCVSLEELCVAKRPNAYAAAYAKAHNQAIHALFRIPQRQVVKLINGKMYEAFIKPIPKEVYLRFGFGAGGKPSTRKIRKIHANLQPVIEAHNDGLYNLIPLILAFDKTIPELRGAVGKGTWKRLCANTISRNKQLAEFIFNPRRGIRDNWTFKSGVAESLDIPTSLLKHGYSTQASMFLAANMKGKWAKQKELDPIEHLFTDTVRMMTRHENEVTLARIDPTKWSLRRLEEEHEKYTRMAYKATYTTDQFNWVKDVPIGPFSFEGYDVIPLFNAFDIGLEGNMMNHCVGSYAELSKAGDYLVFSVRKNGLRHSTIGMRMNLEYAQVPEYPPILSFNEMKNMKEQTFKVVPRLFKLSVTFNQQYMRYNKMLDPKDPANEIPNLIERTLNDPTYSAVRSNFDPAPRWMA